MFFLNGETYLGPGCCAAIKTIQHDCWPNMLGSLGYTTEEGDILRGYCDASDDSGSTGDDSGSAETHMCDHPKLLQWLAHSEKIQAPTMKSEFHDQQGSRAAFFKLPNKSSTSLSLPSACCSKTNE